MRVYSHLHITKFLLFATRHLTTYAPFFFSFYVDNLAVQDCLVLRLRLFDTSRLERPRAILRKMARMEGEVWRARRQRSVDAGSHV